MDYNKYFAQAEEEANESYLNYGGYPSTDADFDDYVEAAGGSQMLNQTGAMGAGGAPPLSHTSLPCQTRLLTLLPRISSVRHLPTLRLPTMAVTQV